MHETKCIDIRKFYIIIYLCCVYFPALLLLFSIFICFVETFIMPGVGGQKLELPRMVFC